VAHSAKARRTGGMAWDMWLSLNLMVMKSLRARHQALPLRFAAL
jgi:hypothetical protein